MDDQARHHWNRFWAGTKQVLGAKDGKGVVRAILEPVAIVLITFASTTAIAQPFYVPSGSMQPTLAIGDAFVAAKYPYGYSRYSVPFGLGPERQGRIMQQVPERGDVVVFSLPADTSKTYIKRVIGLPGDRIQMIRGKLWINGKELALKSDGTGEVEMDRDGTLAVAQKYIETLPNGRQHPIFKMGWSSYGDDTQLFVVPKGNLFMMGDNRDNSCDSRFPPSDLDPCGRAGVGFVPMENLIGRAEFVVGSYDFKNAHAIWSWLGQFRLSRIFNSVD
jgi:signal peptidase I